MESEKQLLAEGLTFLTKVEELDTAANKLTPEIIYNMVCLGLESTFTGLLLAFDEVVDHSSVSSLVRTLAKHYTIPETWITEGRFLNKFNTYCSLDVIAAKIPTNEELMRMRNFGIEVKSFVNSIAN